MMRIGWRMALLVLVLAAVAGVGNQLRAAAKSYQFTGVVKANDGGTLTVEKSPKETWVFDTNKDTKGTAKVGDKVTVYYTMTATQIESKPAAAPAAKSAAPAAPAAKPKK